MPAKLVNIDRKTPMLLPPAIQDWVAKDDPVHLVLEALEAIEEIVPEITEQYVDAGIHADGQDR